MFYRVLFTPDQNPHRDPRHVRHPSLDALVAWMTDSADPGPKLTEATARDAVHERWPEALGMPMPVTVGSGEMTVLAIVPSIRAPLPTETDDPGSFQFPVVAIVLAIPETTDDKKPGRQFQREVWRLPPIEPSYSIAMHENVELRTAELDNPLLMDVDEGVDLEGRRVLHGRAGAGLTLSLMFPYPQRIEDLRFQVFQVEGDPDWYARSDAHPLTIAHGGSPVLALSEAVDVARMFIDAAPHDDNDRVARLLERQTKAVARRGKQEPWAIDKRIAGEEGIGWDGFHVEDASGKRVLTWRDLLQDAAHHEAREYLPWHGPPDWPGVVSVVHPAAWSSVGVVTVESLVRRFRKDVHVVWHGSKWYMVFVDVPKLVNGDQLYSKHDCQWWAVAHPDGTWENLAAS